MKKAFLAIAAVALLFATSCTKENVNPAVDVPEGSFLATIDNGANPQNAPVVKDGMTTKTTINDQRYVIWDAGDQISINGSIYTTQKTGNSVVFSGGDATGSTYHAFYPATIAGTGAAGTLPATQTIETGKVSNLPMYANSTTNQLTFHNICAVLKIVIPSFVNGATRIEVSSSDKAMNGAFTVTDDAAVMTATTPSDAEKKVTIAKASGTFATDEVVYIAVPANTYSNFKVEFFNNTTSMWNKTIATCTLNVNNVYNINATQIPSDCFCFTATAGNVTIGMSKGSNVQFSVSLQYCRYVAATGAYYNWDDFTVGTTTVNLANGDKVYFKATSTNEKFADASALDHAYRFTSSGTGKLSVNGNIMYLLNGTTPATSLTSTTNNYAFCNLFNGMKNLTDASQLNLSATTLSDYCYKCMFEECSALDAVPALPAETLVWSCYHSMFKNCTTLVSVPANLLQAQTLAFYCYCNMFDGCSSLETAPELPATNLRTYCYAQMFMGCSSLNYIKVAFKAWSPSNATTQWVDGVQTTGGTFICPSDLGTDANITRGISKCPDGWTVSNPSNS